MKTFVNSVTHWDTVFATAIFGLSGRKLLSSTMPWISHTGNGYYYPVVPAILLPFDSQKEIRMELNPCLNCARKMQNKNNPVCRKCDMRIEYVNRLEIKLNGTFSYGEGRPPRVGAPISHLSRGASLDI